MNALIHAVRQCLMENGLLSSRLLCCVSGGADSMALLSALCQLGQEAPFHLEALHVQHGLRGEDSQEDERFVRQACETMGVRLTVLSANLSAAMDDPGVETLAREERIRLMKQTMQSGAFDAVLLAHHRDDQAETVLMHLLRGSGMHGLTGMRPCVPFGNGWALRPFLSFSKAELVGAMQKSHLRWREDESNQQPTNARNALRLKVLPQMEQLYPGAGRHIAQTAEVLSAEDDYLDLQTQKLFDRAAYCAPPFRLAAKEPLMDAHPCLVRRLLRRLCPVPIGHHDTLALEALLKAPAGTSLNLPCGVRAVVWTHHLHIVHPDDPSAGGQHLFIHASPEVSSLPQTANEVVLSPAVQARKTILRLPRQDDFIHPFGAAGAKPLRRFFTDRKVDPFFRWQLPVLAAGQEVLWVPGLCASEALRLPSVPEGSIRLTFTVSIPFYPHQSKE